MDGAIINNFNNVRSFLLFLLHESIKSYWVHDVLSDCCFFSGGESFFPLTTNEFFPSISSVSVYFSSFMIALNPTGSTMYPTGVHDVLSDFFFFSSEESYQCIFSVHLLESNGQILLGSAV